MLFEEMPFCFCEDFSAVGCFVESDGQILELLRSPDKKIEPLKWGAPAGKIEGAENSEMAMLRELCEETKLVVLQRQLIRIKTFFIKYPKVNFDYTVFKLIFPFKPEIILNSEHVAYVWICPKYASTLSLVEDEWECIKAVYWI